MDSSDDEGFIEDVAEDTIEGEVLYRLTDQEDVIETLVSIFLLDLRCLIA